ncbi:hypothetical protein [Staphylococcus edaphicus]|uniref:Uncharacterized protein n=1 Tax=Staphylococcus edaphicus TaxID=1955013 RepID=A0A2C6WHH7_9STAP|nr:hypothetical protein [Staphylococcus edaphicus]PHK48570.1 hypothetical protein BTJ66_12945 [Staphylococcus edaphicus]UQW81449.1 hypothetical protein MNY58_12970 [Staphylococcus edaphicus]
MSKALYVHHTINLALMIIFIIFQFMEISSLTISIILLALLLINLIGFIIANHKNVKAKGMTIEDNQKFKR